MSPESEKIVAELRRLVYDEGIEERLLPITNASADHIERLEREKAALRELHRAALMVRSADTYKHPMLSRQEAVEKGVMGLYHALDALDALDRGSATHTGGNHE